MIGQEHDSVDRKAIAIAPYEGLTQHALMFGQHFRPPVSQSHGEEIPCVGNTDTPLNNHAPYYPYGF